MFSWRLAEDYPQTLSANILRTFRKLSIITFWERYLLTLSRLSANILLAFSLYDFVGWVNPLHVAAFYKPPQDPADNLNGLEKALDHLKDFSHHNTKATVLVGGDFHTGDIDWDSLAVKPNSDQKGISECIISFLCDARLTQIQLEPTHQGKVLELLCTSKPSLLKCLKA